MKPVLRTAVLAALGLLLCLPSRPARSQSAANYLLTDLGVLNLTTPYAVANAINDAGQVAGQSKYPDGNIRAFRVNPATVGGQQVWFQDANGDGFNDLMQLLSLPS